MKTEQEENESDSSNTSGLQTSVEISNEQVRNDTNDEIVIDLQSPEYEPETNNNDDCKFYKQSLAKQALAGVF